MTRFVLILLLASAAFPQNTRSILYRAVTDFKAGRIAESVRGFDQAVAADSEIKPHLWQRGIALYYAGRFDDCRDQFESHRTVNGADVENSAWHFLCVARASSFARARESLLPVGHDSRVPMAEIYAMFRGDLTEEGVLQKAGSDWTALFYAHLYVGLFHEARGKTKEALTHIRVAADPKYADHGGYMHDVALVHLRARTPAGSARPDLRR